MGRDPFHHVPKPKGGRGLEPDGRRVAGDTPYKTRAGRIVGLDWDALSRKDDDE